MRMVLAFVTSPPDPVITVSQYQPASMGACAGDPARPPIYE